MLSSSLYLFYPKFVIMKRLLNILIFTILTIGMYAQSEIDPSTVKIPSLDSLNRKTLLFYNFRIVEKDNYYVVYYKDDKADKWESTTLTGRFHFKDSNGRGAYIQLEDGVAVGNWQYYSSTFKGPMIESTVSFTEGYKHGHECLYLHEWHAETESFQSCLRRVMKYNMGKVQHEVWYWEDGKLSSEYHYDDKGKRHGGYIYLSKDGDVWTQGQYNHGQYSGTWKYFAYLDNKTDIQNLKKKYLSKQEIYKDGGVYTQTFYSNGKPRESKITRDRVYEGKYLHLTEQGDTIEYHNYKDGIEQGYQVKWIRSVAREAQIKTYYYTNDEGILQGDYIQIFTDTGRLRVKGQYNAEGLRDGIWEYYQKDGRLYRTETIENGWIKASRTRWLLDKKGNYINAQYHKEQYPSGKIPKREDKRPFFLFSE